MLRTEEEARACWCPASYQKSDGPWPCTASLCMAWRWEESPRRETLRLYLDTKEVDGVPVVRAGTLRMIKGESWRYEYTDVDVRGEFEYLHRAAPEGEPRRGYCGLAGTSA